MHKFIVDMTIITELNTNTILPVDVIYIYVCIFCQDLYGFHFGNIDRVLVYSIFQLFHPLFATPWIEIILFILWLSIETKIREFWNRLKSM
jgi:hypothetical protein